MAITEYYFNGAQKSIELGKSPPPSVKSAAGGEIISTRKIEEKFR